MKTECSFKSITPHRRVPKKFKHNSEKLFECPIKGQGKGTLASLVVSKQGSLRVKMEEQNTQ